MKRKVIVAFLKDSVNAPGAGVGGDTTLNAERHDGMEMYTGIEPGFLMVYHRKVEFGVPLSNVRSLVWEPAEPVKK